MTDEIEKIVPGSDDENVGEGFKKKKEKKRKSKEERVADRKIVFWVMIVMVVITGMFYLLPIIRGDKRITLPINTEDGAKSSKDEGVGIPKWKDYTEVTF